MYRTLCPYLFTYIYINNIICIYDVGIRFFFKYFLPRSRAADAVPYFFDLRFAIDNIARVIIRPPHKTVGRLVYSNVICDTCLTLVFVPPFQIRPPLSLYYYYYYYQSIISKTFAPGIARFGPNQARPAAGQSIVHTRFVRKRRRRRRRYFV